MNTHSRSETETESKITAAKVQTLKTNTMQQKYLKQKKKENADFSTV
jgi:hypothetical protein